MPGSTFLDLGLEEGPGPHLDVHNVRVPEPVEEVLELDEGLALVLDLAEVGGRDAPEGGLEGEGLVDGPLGAARALLPDGAWAGGGEGVWVPRELEPGGGRGGGARGLAPQEHVACRRRQLQGVLRTRGDDTQGFRPGRAEAAYFHGPSPWRHPLTSASALPDHSLPFPSRRKPLDGGFYRLRLNFK